jgi:hypothetical protein
MPTSSLTARFVTEAEAARAATMLRAAGIPDSSIQFVQEGPEELGRDDEVGVPDSSAGLSGFRTNEPSASAVVALHIADLEQARVSEDELRRIIESAGGRTEED